MAYFPHAYQKMMVAKPTSAFITGAGTTSALLTAGQIALVDYSTNQSVLLSASTTHKTMAYLAQGSYYSDDNLGPFHGGYKESVKSKGINPKYVSAFYVTEPAAAVANVIGVHASTCNITCDTTYRLRVDVKGSPALRFLTHNAYLTVDGYSGCCNATDDNVDPNVVMLQWRDQINNSPIISKFITAALYNNATDATLTAAATATDTITVADTTDIVVGQLAVAPGIPGNTTVKAKTSTTIQLQGPADISISLTNGTVVEFYDLVGDADDYVPVTSSTNTVDSYLILTGAYVDTKFGNASFSPKDFFELQPVQIYTSFVESNGDTCAVSCFTSSEMTQAYQGKGYGETLVRELILDKAYRQEPWQQDPRMREVLKDTVLSYIDGNGSVVNGELNRSSKYYVYHILHSVPRKSNPTGTMDNDQYLVKVVTPSRNASFEVGFLKFLNNGGNYDCGTAGTATIGSTGITVQK